MSLPSAYGLIAGQFGEQLPIEILVGDAGFYLGTRDDGLPFSRESEEYFATREQARQALSTGRWTQRECGYPRTGEASAQAFSAQR